MNLTLILVIGAVLVLWLTSRGTSRTTSTARMDKSSGRWGIAVHEAGHAVAAKRMGGKGVRGKMTDNGGWVHATFKDDADVDCAVFLLAGGAAGRRVSSRYSASSHDERSARRVLRGTGVSYGKAQSKANRLVSGNWGAVQSSAQRMYRTGHL